MIKNVTVINHLGESVVLELRNPEKSGFLIRDIDGLDPAKSTIYKTEVNSVDGARIDGTRVNSRNITLTFDLIEKPTIESSRHTLYKYFPLKMPLQLIFESDERVCTVSGYVESNSINLFSQNQRAVISIVCEDSYLYSTENAVTIFGALNPAFEFPFSNESLSEPLIIMGNIDFNPLANVFYEGEAPVGVIFNIHAIGEITEIEIENPWTLEKLSINDAALSLVVGSGIIAGDDILISTIKGNKVAYLTRGGITYNIRNSLGRNPKWFQLQKGDNLFRYSAGTGMTNLQFTVENRIAYVGI